MTAELAGSRSPEFVRSLERGLSVFTAFDAEHPHRSLSEVARATGLTPAAARRFLLTLVEQGYVEQRDGRFSLLPRVLELGYAHLSNLSLPAIADPHLVRLARQLQGSASLAVLDGDDVLYLARASTPAHVTVAIDVGARFPAYATAMGRVLLAGLPEAELDGYLTRTELRPLTPRTIVDPVVLRAEVVQIRSQGWSLVDQDLEEGVLAVAVPLHWRSGRVIGALNASTHAVASQVESRRRVLLPPLLATATAVEADLQVYPSLHRSRSPGGSGRPAGVPGWRK